MNTQGIKSKIDQLEILTCERNIDICCFSETFLKNHESETVQLEGYIKAAHFSRKKVCRGGVCIYVKNQISYNKLDWINEMSIEKHFECCGITVSDLNYTVVCVYRTPGSNLNLFIQCFENLLHKLTLRTRAIPKKVLILGDFNINLLERNNKSELFINTINFFNLHPTITEATRITAHSQTCIDNILTNIKRYKTEVLNVGISDHTAQLISVTSNLSFKEKYWFSERRKVDLYLNIFLKYLSQINFSEVFKYDEPNKAYSEFIELYSLIFKLCIPLEKVKITYKKRPNWKTSGIKIASKNKRRIYLQTQKEKNNQKLGEYKMYCKTLKKVICTSRKISNIRYINRSTNKSKATWGIIKQHTSSNNNIKTTVESINMNGTNIVEPSTIASIMNKHFIELNKTSDNNNKPQQKCLNQNCKTIFMHPVTIQEVKNIVKELKNKKSTGHDGISMQLIKSSIDYIAEPLVYIINLSIETGCFPNDLKKALVKPLYKKGSKKQIENYRPIAILPSFSKLFEKIIYNRIILFLDSTNSLNTNQFGFRKKKNTSLAIFKVLKQVWEEINNKKTGVALFLDLSRAFDCVVHKILLSKLEAAGIRGTALTLLESYLSNRSQSTVLEVYNRNSKTVEQEQSDFQNIVLGVPQGSILGPLLFLVYINELPLITKHLCVMFADDATIFIPQTDKYNFQSEVNNTLDTVTNWLKEINLQVNIEKTKVMQFKNYKMSSLNLDIKIKGSPVVKTNETIFLGVTLDSHLNWKAHINKINNKMSKYCYALSILSRVSSKHIATNAYYGYIYPQLSYGIIFWGNSGNVQSTFIMQKRCLRNIFNLETTDSLRNIFKEYKFLTVTGIYILEICTFVKNNAEHFFAVQSSRLSNLRNKHKFNICVPQSNNTMYYKSSFVSAVRIYNHLSPDLKSLNGNKFKYNLKEWLISKVHYSLSEFYNTSEYNN